MSTTSENLLDAYANWVLTTKVAGVDVSPGAFLHGRYLEALRKAVVLMYSDEEYRSLATYYLDEEFHDRLAEDVASLPVGIEK